MPPDSMAVTRANSSAPQEVVGGHISQDSDSIDVDLQTSRVSIRFEEEPLPLLEDFTPDSQGLYNCSWEGCGEVGFGGRDFR